MTEKCYEGWADHVRVARKGKLLFVDLHISGKKGEKMQVVISGDKDAIQKLRLTRHCALRVTGTLVDSPGDEQDTELQATPDQVEVMGLCDVDGDPIAKTGLTLEYLRTKALMWRSRTELFRSVFWVRDLVIRSIHKFYEEKGYMHIQAPLITKSDCEGAGEAFRVTADGCKDFFGKTPEGEPVDAFLTVSGQLQGEVMAAALGPIYTLGHTFRAEKSRTTRHLSEFLMMEPEIPFATLDDIVKESIELLKYITQTCLSEGASYLKVLDSHTPGLIGKLEKFMEDDPVVITYTEAIERLKTSEVKFEETPDWGIDLGSEHETWLCGDKLTILTDYPKDIKAFYMYANPDEKTVACMDVLLPGIGEVIGGSQRESRLDVLEPKMVKLGLDGSEYDFYRDIRKYGYAGSSGFGLGVARMIRFVTGMKQIRDVIPFPVAYGKIHT